MSLPPLLYHYFQLPLPYARTLAVQESIHALQLALRRSKAHQDILLLLEHRPVYTTGRRQLSSAPEVLAEETRLTRLGADFVTTQRGGQITYHGPGQLIGYPLMDLGRTTPPVGIREYICKMQTTLKLHLSEAHGIKTIPSDNTGVFTDPFTKIASIGVQVRHRLTTHGFGLNITPEIYSWFSQVVACGLANVRPTSIADATITKKPGEITVSGEIQGLVRRWGKVYGRDMERLDVGGGGELAEIIRALEEEARAAALPPPPAVSLHLLAGHDHISPHQRIPPKTVRQISLFCGEKLGAPVLVITGFTI
ncbi:lipoyltransferase [Cristinia sonorae]|uniref:lipoyl(octanoyl) transferase n=1 Tax=Cristinia sonorae TaxID=1940300 RepID=A0A8K0XL52_9AGAR|nr:lipoyltransferase [Cristinia sonorae]